MLVSSLRMLLCSIGVLYTLCMVALAMILGRRAMSFRCIFVMFGCLRVLFSCHFMLLNGPSHIRKTIPRMKSSFLSLETGV